MSFIQQSLYVDLFTGIQDYPMFTAVDNIWLFSIYNLVKFFLVGK